MPGLFVHTLLAHRTLAAWQSEGGSPFPTDDEAAVNAFLGGALGPDMGLFPGGTPFITDLSHYVQSGVLVRALVAEARSPVETAFAWGWATHVLADAAIHPLVNRGVGSLLFSDPTREVPYFDDPVAHVQVEMGLDGATYFDYEVSGPRWFRPALDEKSVEFVSRAFGTIYGQGVVSSEELLKSHRASARYSRPLSRVLRLLGARLTSRHLPRDTWSTYLLAFLPARMWSGVASRTSPMYGLTHAVLPPEWLRAALDEQVRQFDASFLEACSTGLADLPNYNLDTGRVDSDSTPYPLTEKTLQALKARRASIAGSVEVARP